MIEVEDGIPIDSLYRYLHILEVFICFGVSQYHNTDTHLLVLLGYFHQGGLVSRDHIWLVSKVGLHNLVKGLINLIDGFFNFSFSLHFELSIDLLFNVLLLVERLQISED